MASRRVLIDVEDFNRRRGVAALVRGDSLDLEEVPRRPNAAILGGIVLTLLIAAVSAGTAYLNGRAPDGWRDDGSLVLDRETGARFLAMGQTLRPAPTLTSALLAGGRGDPVLVPHEKVTEAPLGPPLPGAGLPERPPTLPGSPPDFTACLRDVQALDVYATPPRSAPSRYEGMLVRASGTREVVLVSGRRAHAVDPDVLPTLGYFPGQVRDVPAAWLDLVPRGPQLARLQPPGRRGPGVQGVGKNGHVVAAQSRRRYLVDAGKVRPFVNRTSELLAPAPVRTVPDAVLLAAPTGPGVGIADAPATPPVVPPREVVLAPCVRSSDGLLSVAEAVADDQTRPSLPRKLALTGGRGLSATWHFRPGEGALVGPLDVHRPRDPGQPPVEGTGGVRLVAEGVGHEVADTDALRALGYRKEQAVPLAPAWLSLLEPGPQLSTLR